MNTIFFFFYKAYFIILANIQRKMREREKGRKRERERGSEKEILIKNTGNLSK